MEEVAFLILVVGCGLALAIPLIIFGIFLHRVRILKQSWKRILLKVVCAVVVWACLSCVMLFFNFAFVYASAHMPPATGADVRPVITLLTLTVVYALAGSGLCYWVGRTVGTTDYDLGLT